MHIDVPQPQIALALPEKKLTKLTFQSPRNLSDVELLPGNIYIQKEKTHCDR